jgi:transposase
MVAEEVSRIEIFRQFKKEIRGNEKILIVGIDVAKSIHHAFFGTANGKTVLKGLRITNDADGFLHLVTRAHYYMNRDGFEQVVFGIEPTSVYHKPLAEHLVNKGHLVVYVTNDAIKKNRSLIDGRWDKNDTKDSANVADLISQAKCHYYDYPEDDLRDLRNLLLLRKRLRKQIHSCQIRIKNNLLAQYFPELDPLWKKAEDENLAIVRWCLPPQKMAQMEFEKFVSLFPVKPKKVIQRDRLRKIWEASKHSIGCRGGLAMEQEAVLMVEQARFVKGQMAQVEKGIQGICSKYEAYGYLLSIPGFGPYVSAVVLAAIGNPYRFENVSQLIKLAGLDLNANRSGTRSASAIPVISKKGKSELRYALYQAAKVASSLSPIFRGYYNRLLEGRQKERGIGTKMRVKLSGKLLVIAWTLMKKRQPFDPAYIAI